MGGDENKETSSPKMFAKVRSVFRSRSRGPMESRRSARQPTSSPSTNDHTKSVVVPSPGPASLQQHTVVAPSNDEPGPTIEEGASAVDPRTNSSPARRDHTPFIAASDSFGDQERTESRYKAAAKNLEEALRVRASKWESFDPSILTFDISKNDPISQLQEQIQSTLDSRKNKVKIKSFWEKGKSIVERTFTATSPFAKIFLTIAKEGQAITALNPYGLLCGGLLVLITIADKEIERRKEIENMLDYISRQLGQLEIIKSLPEAGVPPEQLVNRALDVLSAAIHYLAVHIRRESAGLGIIRYSPYFSLPNLVENIGSTILKGDAECRSADAKLQNAVDEFYRTLNHFGHSVSFKIFDEVRDIVSLREGDVRRVEAPTFQIATFIVPYKRNVHFTGRESLIATLCTKLSETVQKKYNHQVALYGLGGIGKTQLAIEYAYSHKDNYEWVFWVSAADQSTLLSDFQQIGRRTRCISNYASLQPKDATEQVLHWLNVQNSWLLIVDNLDTIEVADGYLPDVSTTKHILITTRNQHCHHIPAEGLKVTTMPVEDAVELLLTRAEIEDNPDKKSEVAKIVAELGCLPLAIEQAAAFIRETSKDIFGYLTSYRRNRQLHHGNASKANRKYYQHSVSTVWSMSLHHLENENADSLELLRLLAFLNPDGILIEFLEAGKDGLGGALKDVISDNDRLCAALSDLERFSLIGRQEDGLKAQRITIHRLVQAVVKDEMSEELRQAMADVVARLSNAAFPDMDYNDFEVRTLSRRFQDQVVGPLTAIELSSTEFEDVLHRVGYFLGEDGNHRQAIEFLTRATADVKDIKRCEDVYALNRMVHLATIYGYEERLQEGMTLIKDVLHAFMKLRGDDDPRTLRAMMTLAYLYRLQWQFKEHCELLETVFKIRRKVLDKDNPLTLTTMALLAECYRSLQRLPEARDLGEKCLETLTRVLGEDHPDSLKSMIYLSRIYTDLGEHENAIKLNEKVWGVSLTLLGHEHSTTLSAMENLGVSYCHVGRYEETASLQEMSLEARQRTLGPEHSDTLRNMMNLGDTYRRLGKLDESIALLEMSEAASVVKLGNENPATLYGMHYLACAYHDAGRLDDSVKLFEQVVSRRKKVLGDNHPSTKASVEWLQVSLGESQQVPNENLRRTDIWGDAYVEDNLGASQTLNEE